MVKEKVLLVGDSLAGPTGFANDLAGIAWGLAEKFDVHALGLQSFQDEKVKLNIQGIERIVHQHANQPRTNQRWDFGQRSLPRLLDNLEPEILLTVNDIQMVQHIPGTMCPNTIQLNVVDLPYKQYVSEVALQEQLKGQMQRFKERFPRVTKWVQYAPQDGDPPMPQWEHIYKMADNVIAMSKYGQWVFKQWFGMNVPFIYHGVDTNIFNKRDTKPKGLKDKFIVGNLNRNQPRKQPIRTMMAFARFARDKPDALLQMQMDWNDEFGWPIEYFGQQYGIMNKMIQPGPVGMPRKAVADTYNLWDLNLNATGGEGFGLTHIEGFACGVPSLGCDYTTSRELIMEGEPGPRGSLLKVLGLHWQMMDVAAVRRSLVDIDDFVKILNKYYYNRDLIIQHGKNAMEWTQKNVSWDIIGKQWIKQIENILSGDNNAK